jgi:hypothetical protein
MKRFAGWAVSAGLVLAASAANAQMPVSDFDGPYDRPYGAVPPPPPPAYNQGAYGPGSGPGPALLPPQEVYAVLRDNGFSPLGVPHQRGFVYTIAVIDRSGEDGRLVIDARNGRIIRFVPAWGQGPNQGLNQGPYPGRYGDNFPAERMSGYGPEVALPPPTAIRGTPQPPAAVPHVASRAVPLPAPKPSAAGRLPDPTPRQSAAVETRSATPPAPAQAAAPPPAPANSAPAAQASVSTPPASATVAEAKPAPVIQPTQQMPAAQGLE